MIEKISDSYPVNIYMAGDINMARHALSRYTRTVAVCARIADTSYIYPGGEERGFVVSLLNYPKFEKTNERLLEVARDMAEFLRDNLYQDSYTIEAPNRTIWNSFRKEVS